MRLSHRSGQYDRGGSAGATEADAEGISATGDKEDQELKGPAVLKPQRGKKSGECTRGFKEPYEQVARMFGITVGSIRLDRAEYQTARDDVDFYTAMQLLGSPDADFLSRGELDVIFVASDTIAKRKEYSEEVEQTFRLDSAVAPEDMTELLRVLREITNSTRITMDTKNHSLTAARNG